MRPLPAKVQVPWIAARIEDRFHCSGSTIENGLTGSFSERTRNARQGQVIQFRLTICRKWNDMIHMEERFLSGLRQAAIFAPLLSPLQNTAAERVRNIHPAQPGYL